MKHLLDYYIMNMAPIHEVFDMTGQEIKVYLQLLSHASDTTCETYVGTPTVAKNTGLHRRSVMNGFASLKDKGAMELCGKEKGTNKYRLLFPSPIPAFTETKDDGVSVAKGGGSRVAKGDAKHDAKGDARVRHHESTFPQVNTSKANSEKEEEKKDEKELDPESVFLSLYGHIIDIALKRYLHLLPSELCSPAFQDAARNALTEKLRARLSAGPPTILLKGNARSERIAQEIADELTNEERLPGGLSEFNHLMSDCFAESCHTPQAQLANRTPLLALCTSHQPTDSRWCDKSLAPLL